MGGSVTYFDPFWAFKLKFERGDVVMCMEEHEAGNIPTTFTEGKIYVVARDCPDGCLIVELVVDKKETIEAGYSSRFKRVPKETIHTIGDKFIKQLIEKYNAR